MLGRQDGARVRHWLTLITGLLECLCFAGVVFGWASLVFILKREGYFSDLCINVTAVNSSVDTVISSILFPALSLITVGGMLFLITNMQVGNLFGSHRSTIITLYNGAFDSSSSVFLIFKVLHEAGISLRSSFLFMSGCSVIHLLRTFILLPKDHIPYPLPEGYTYGMSFGKSKSYTLERAGKAAEAGSKQSEGMKEMVPLQPEDKLETQSPPETGPSYRACVLSWFFLFQLVWLSVMQLRHYLFIGTLNPMLTRLTNGDPTLVSRYTNAFAFTQMCGVLCAPWNGVLMDRNKGKPPGPGETERDADLRSSVLSLFLTALQCLLFSICATIPVLPLQYLTFVLQVLNRSFLYGGTAAFVSIAFPACHFGKLYGLMMSLSAVVSLLQYPCFALVKEVLDGDPLYVNIGLTLLTLLAFIHPLYVYLHCRRQRRAAQGDELQAPKTPAGQLKE
ncbi:hypothetical protein JZ751_015434 [Albula glossodonta]|uniref:Solute carrier family 43 member 3 n=1 Tax=Albula glossodonta TaxID=121402 RepID=A0A8T2MX56_9TELE|nr:hypothetical protein JZ751_015434 [Albula glossodonta]